MLEKNILKNVSLRSTEEFRGIVRQSLWHYFWQILIIAVLITLPFFLIYPLFKKGEVGISIFFLLLISGLIMAGRLFYVYNHTAFIMTTDRLIDIDQKGFFNKAVSEVLYDKVQNVSFKTKGIFRSVMKIGDIDVDLTGIAGGRITKIKLKTIKRPKEVVATIVKLQEKFLATKMPDREPAVKLLQRIKKRLGPDKFARLIAD